MAENGFYVIWDTELDQLWMNPNRFVWRTTRGAKSAWSNNRIPRTAFVDQSRYVVKEVSLVPIGDL